MHIGVAYQTKLFRVFKFSRFKVQFIFRDYNIQASSRNVYRGFRLFLSISGNDLCNV